MFRLAVRALAWRAVASAAVFAVALLAIAAAAVGPLYLRAVDESLLHTRLLATTPATRDVHISRATLDGVTGVDWGRDVDALAARAAGLRWFAAPVHDASAPVTLARRGGTRYASALASVDGLCGHLTIVSGRCVASGAVAETVLTGRSAAALHVGAGDLIKPVPASGGVTPVPLRVVGVAEPADPSGTFWSRFPLLTFAPTISDSQLPRLDAFLVSPAALTSRRETLVQTIAVDVPLRPATVRLGDIDALREAIKGLQADAAVRNRGAISAVAVGSGLGAALDALHHEMSLSRTLILLPTLQLVLLAIFVLYAVVAGTTGVQAPEVALAKLRGRRPRSVLAQGVLQPVVLILLAAPVASVLAWLLVRAVAGHVLAGPVTVGFPVTALGAVAAAAGGAVLATAVAARRIVVSPVGALLRRGPEPSASPVGAAVADAAAVALAGAGLVQLMAGGVLDGASTDPLSALAPTLIALAAAVVALRLLPLAGRLLVRATRDSGRLATFLSVRQVVRRPAGARPLVAVAVAVALGTFAVANWSVARTNREHRALNAAGARTVFDVEVGPRVGDVRAAVGRADPAGHSMAAAVVRTGGTPMLAVDTDRFAGVGAWQRSNAARGLADLLAALRSGAAAPMAFTGTQLSVTARVTQAPRGGLGLGVWVTGADHRQTLYDLGRLRPGANTSTVVLSPVCATGCRVTGLAFTSTGAADAAGADARPALRAELTAAALNQGHRTPVAGFADPSRWRADDPTGGGVARAGAALAVTLQQQPGSPDWPALRSADVPTHLPALLGTSTAATYPAQAVHDASAPGLDGRSLPLDGIAVARTLPQLDREGALVDLGLAERAMTSPASDGVHFQVWAGAGAPANLKARLAAQGLRVTHVTRAADFRRDLDRTGPAFAGTLFLVAAGAAAVLALAAAVVGGIVTARRRAYELAALLAVGVPRRALRRATAAEQGVVLAGGLAVGLLAGLLGSRLALPSTPFFVDESVGPPTVHDLPWGLLAPLAAAVAAAFLLASVIGGRLVTRQATAARLREGQA